MTPDILTYSGHYFDFEHPERSRFNMVDVAHALAHICRFTGHVRQFYSVAQHSVLVSHLVPPSDALAGLLHDAAEAFIGDVSKPLKQLLPDYKVIERRVEVAVLARFGLPPTLPVTVKAADLRMLGAEKRDLMPIDPGTGWECLAGLMPAPDKVVPVGPAAAKEMFLRRAAELMAERHGAPAIGEHQC